MFGLAKGVLLCVAITFFAVTLLPPAQGEAIVASQSGRYIVALLDKSHSVFPPEIHQVIDPYLHKIEERLNPNFQSHAGVGQNVWPAQSAPQTPTNDTPWPQISWPQGEPAPQQSTWPAAPQPDVAWPAETQPPSESPTRDNPYAVPREPNPAPGPYSAGAPGSRTY
jgi:membrane protein required for colicin V production